jgi:hypothetical protein
MHATKLIVITILTLAFAPTFSMAKSEDETSLWKIQKTLASKKYVDLTHAFAPAIPRWPGFPDETRKPIYWYDKRPDTLGAGFFRRYSRMSGSGERTSIRRRISSKNCARWTKLTLRK